MATVDCLGRVREPWSLAGVEALADMPDNVVGVMDVHKAQDLARFAIRAVRLLNMIDRGHPDVAAFMGEWDDSGTVVDSCHDCMLSAPAMCGGAYCNRDAEIDRIGSADE